MKKGPYKMKGFTGFGNSPVKAKSEAAKNLLKAVPNEDAYKKLSDENKKGFDKAAKKAGLPTKPSPNKLVNKNRKLKKTDKKIKKKQTKEIKERLSKLSTEELMKMREAKKSPAKKSTDREKKIARNTEFNKVAEQKGLKPPRPKAGDAKALKAYEKFYSNKANVNMLNKKQKEYFKDKN